MPIRTVRPYSRLRSTASKHLPAGDKLAQKAADLDELIEQLGHALQIAGKTRMK